MDAEQNGSVGPYESRLPARAPESESTLAIDRPRVSEIARLLVAACPLIRWLLQGVTG